MTSLSSDPNDFTLFSLGVEKVGSYRSEKENVDEDILSLGKGP